MNHGRKRTTGNACVSTLSWCVLGFLSVAPAECQPAAPESVLRIEVRSGEGAVHPAHERSGIPIEVQILDERDRPVQGAMVVFSSPGNGAGARFLNDASTAEVSADEQGLARVAGVRGNNAAGSYQIRVSASFEGKTGSANVAQQNEKAPLITTKRMSIAGAAAAAIVVPILALRSSPPPKAAISTVAPSGPVGAP